MEKGMFEGLNIIIYWGYFYYYDWGFFFVFDKCY